MHTNKSFFVAFIASLFLSSLVFGQSEISKKETPQTQDSTKTAATEKKSSEQEKIDAAAKAKADALEKSKAKHKRNTSSSKPKPKPKDVPEVELTNARITYDHTEYDFGSVAPGARVSHNFPVTNTGPDTLNITKIKAG